MHPDRPRSRGFLCWIGITAAACLLVACSEQTGVETTSKLAGTSWQVEVVDQTTITAIPPVTLTFDNDGRAKGSAGCNRYFAEFQQSGNQLTFATIGSTRKLCPPPVMASERNYLSALEQVQSWRIEGGKLLLSRKNGREVVSLGKTG